MKRIYSALILILALVGTSRQMQATHIVGAELYYECQAPTNDTYDLTLKLYRDCQNGQAPYDQFITLFIFDGLTGVLNQTLSVPVPPNTPQLNPNFTNCVVTPPTICVEEGIYETSVVLPPNNNGYNIAWARCCRNQLIDNLMTPLNEGITFLAHIPPSSLAICNTMPTFTQVPPIFLCVDELFAFDHSAYDSDGDSLSYRLTDPYTGTNYQNLGAGNPNFGGNQPVVDPSTNPMGPPPYNNVIFNPGFTYLNPFGSGNFVIDPFTGFITVTPNQTGIFVYSISVYEWRNGQLLSENRRDFQIHVLDCIPQGMPPVITHDFGNLPHNGDTLCIEGGQSFCYDITITDPIATDVVIPYTVSAVFGNGPMFPPWATFNWSGTNPVTGQVCWTPSCLYDGQVVPLVIGAYDPEDCENNANVFDTAWVKVMVPPNLPPQIEPDFTGLNVSGDTITIAATESFCVPFTVTDSNLNDLLETYPLSSIFSGPNPPTFNIMGTNPITGEICWTPDCDLQGQTIEFTIGASDSSECQTGFPTQTTYYVDIVVPPNDPPAILANLTGNTYNGDTIFVFAEDSLCFTFNANDPDVGDVLTFNPISAVFFGPNPPDVITGGVNPMGGQICWEPDCSYEGQLVEFIFGVEDPGVCDNIGEALDTVYVMVEVPPNDGPSITTDLTGNVYSNDTIFLFAEEELCFSFTITDPNGADSLFAYPLSPVFTGPNPPSFTVTGLNPLNGEICWIPDCQYIGSTVPLIFGGEDNGKCSSQLDTRDTVYVVIDIPPNDAPTALHNLSGLNSNGDTIFVDAAESFCYTVTFDDINTQDILSPTLISSIFSGPNAATFTFTGTNPLEGEICWTPECEDEGALIEFIIQVQDDAACNNIKEVFDTVYVQVSNPFTTAPIVGHDLSGLNYSGDTAYMEVGDQICFDFYIADQTKDNGMLYDLEYNSLFGSTLNVISLDVTTQNDSITGTICFEADCSNGGTYYQVIIIGIDKATCPPFEIARDTVTIKVNTDFMSFAGVDTSFCEGSGGVQLNVTPIGGTAPYYYTWGCNNPGACGLSNTYAQNPIANPTDTTTYYVQITDFNGCTSEIDDVDVNVLRQPIVDAGPDTSRCEGGPGIFMQATIINPLEAPGPYTYQWIPGAGLNDSTISTPYATPDTTTIYTVIVVSANGCSSFNTTLDTLSTVEVEVKKRPIVDAGEDKDICLGEEVLLYGFASGAGPDYEYIWTPAYGLNDSSQQATTASPSFTTTYFFVSYSNGCPSVADSVTIHVHTLPTVDPGTVYEICWGDTIQLNGTASGDSTAEYYTYEWSPALGLDDPFSATPNASPKYSQTYTLVATSSFDCVSPPYEVELTVLSQPIVDAGPDTIICLGDTIQLNGTHLLSHSTTDPVFYSWTPPEGLSGLFVPDPKANPEQSTVYYLEVSVGACTGRDSILVSLSESINAIVSADTNRICSGDSVQLFATGGLGSATFLWSPADGLSDPTAQNPMAAPDETTLFTLEINEGACKNQKGIEILVHPTPKADYFLSQELGCAPFTVSFLEQSESGVNFIWDFGDGTIIQNVPNPTHTFETPGIYPISFTAIGAGGCQQSYSDGSVWVLPAGIANFSAQPDLTDSLALPHAEVQFTDLSENAISYLWDFGDGQFSTETDPLHIYESPGSYHVLLTITDEAGCVDTFRYGPFVIYEPNLLIPNVFTPNADGVNDVYYVKYDGKEPVSIQIHDRWGRFVFEDQVLSWDGINYLGQPAVEGVYFYVIRIGQKTFKGHLSLFR